MKKTFCFILAAAILLLCACAPAQSAPAAALDELMPKILDGTDAPNSDTIELTEENFENYAFIKMPDGAEGLASEALINAVAHSVVLLRLSSDADAAAAAKSIKENANPRKWICVEAEKTVVEQNGSLVLLAMSFTDTADKIAENFKAL